MHLGKTKHSPSKDGGNMHIEDEKHKIQTETKSMLVRSVFQFRAVPLTNGMTIVMQEQHLKHIFRISCRDKG